MDDGGDAVEGATVCLWMKNDLVKKYFVDKTNGDGEVIFNIGQGGCNNAILTVSYDQQNYLPYQDDSFSTD